MRRCVVLQKVTGVSEEYTATIFMVEEKPNTEQVGLEVMYWVCIQDVLISSTRVGYRFF
jgi:hypothetical protein